jgi:hypothetical protein
MKKIKLLLLLDNHCDEHHDQHKLILLQKLVAKNLVMQLED